MKSPRFVRLAWLFALPLALVLARPAAAGLLADSTMTDGWKLANGLEVRLRHVPGAAGVAVTVAYRAGRVYEPAGRAGMAHLLAELQYMSPAGEIPERSRDEMPSLRPMGWGTQVNERLAVLTEVAAPDRFPGVLHQVAIRMRGANPTQADLDRAMATLRADFGNRQFGRADLALYYRVRELAEGATDEEIVRMASGAALGGLTLKDVRAQLQALYVPANACLAIAGDLGEIDVRTLVEREFGGIPGGTAQPSREPAALAPAVRTTPFAGIEKPYGVAGVFAPAVEDTLHPAFYLAMVVSGPWMSNTIGRPSPPLTSRFQYSLYDEPDLVRFYPEPSPTETDAATLGMQLHGLVDRLGETHLERDALEAVRRSVVWLLGGPLPKPVKDQMHRQSGALGTLASGMASRALWKGDEFWDGYRRRFETTLRAHNTFSAWLTDPRHQALLLLTPRR